MVGGRVDSGMLASQVADHLAVWEHKLDSALGRDPSAEAGLELTLTRYPADQRINVDQDERINLGGGAALDVYANVAEAPDSQPAPRVTVSFGQVWLLVLGPTAPSRLPSELVSDGTELWASSDGD